MYSIHDGKSIINYRASKTIHSIRRSSFKMRANLQNWGLWNTHDQKKLNPFANTWWKHQKNEFEKNTWSQNHSICSWLSTSRSDFAEIHQNQPCQMMPIQSVFFIQNAIWHKLHNQFKRIWKQRADSLFFDVLLDKKLYFELTYAILNEKHRVDLTIFKRNVFIKNTLQKTSKRCFSFEIAFFSCDRTK